MAKPKRAADPNGVFAVRLRDCLEKQNISQSKLAASIGKSRQAVNFYTLGETVPDANTLVSISKQLRVSVDYLLGIPLTVHQSTIKDIKNTINECIEKYESANKVALHYVQKIQQLTHQLTAADTPTDDETADEYAGVNRDFSGGRYDGT